MPNPQDDPMGTEIPPNSSASTFALAPMASACKPLVWMLVPTLEFFVITVTYLSSSHFICKTGSSNNAENLVSVDGTQYIL